jgi:hypothetical protein
VLQHLPHPRLVPDKALRGECPLSDAIFPLVQFRPGLVRLTFDVDAPVILLCRAVDRRINRLGSPGNPAFHASKIISGT